MCWSSSILSDWERRTLQGDCLSFSVWFSKIFVSAVILNVVLAQSAITFSWSDLFSLLRNNLCWIPPGVVEPTIIPTKCLLTLQTQIVPNKFHTKNLLCNKFQEKYKYLVKKSWMIKERSLSSWWSKFGLFSKSTFLFSVSKLNSSRRHLMSGQKYSAYD